MKIALLADIHGNALALEAVLHMAAREGVDELFLLGDFVGYYFQPGKVLELLAPWKVTAIRGNHETLLTECAESAEALNAYEKKYGRGLRMAMEQLDDGVLSGLMSLPERQVVTRDGYTILMCHGSPWDPDKYIYPDAPEPVFARFAELETDVVLMGHTHYPLIRRIGATLLVNPGSVGQPRDKRPGAAWALFDTESGEVEFRREQYDIAQVVMEAGRINPEIPYLAEVLERE